MSKVAYDTREQQLALARETAETMMGSKAFAPPLSRRQILELARAINDAGRANFDMLDGLEDVAAVVRDVHHGLCKERDR